MLTLYMVCSDQYIIGPAGAAGLNDIAIQGALTTYFDVEKEDRLVLSLAVRKFANKVLKLLTDAKSRKS